MGLPQGRRVLGWLGLTPPQKNGHAIGHTSSPGRKARSGSLPGATAPSCCQTKAQHPPVLGGGGGTWAGDRAASPDLGITARRQPCGDRSAAWLRRPAPPIYLCLGP